MIVAAKFSGEPEALQAQAVEQTEDQQEQRADAPLLPTNGDKRRGDQQRKGGGIGKEIAHMVERSDKIGDKIEQRQR